MPEFFQTIMGRKFFERDVPSIAKSLETIAGRMERQDKLEQALHDVLGAIGAAVEDGQAEASLDNCEAVLKARKLLFSK